MGKLSLLTVVSILDGFCALLTSGIVWQAQLLWIVPGSPVALNRPPISIYKYSIPCVLESILTNLHTWFISHGFRMPLDFYTCQTTVTENENEFVVKMVVDLSKFHQFRAVLTKAFSLKNFKWQTSGKMGAYIFYATYSEIIGIHPMIPECQQKVFN